MAFRPRAWPRTWGWNVNTSRNDASTYIRQLLDQYADALQIPRLPSFVARYAFATDRHIERWFVGENTATQYIPKTTRRLNRDLTYPHSCWRVYHAPLPLMCHLSERHPLLIPPHLVWICDVYTEQVMGFCLCATPPTCADLLLALRWSIWHYDAPWWTARGAPELLEVPTTIHIDRNDLSDVLAYLHTTIVRPAAVVAQAGADAVVASVEPHGFVGFSEPIAQWLATLADQIPIGPQREITTLAAVRTLLLAQLRREMATTTFATPTPTLLAQQQVSLPWSVSIASAGLLPSGGLHRVADGTVVFHKVPFDTATSGLRDGQPVELRFDPDDARIVYLVSEAVRVVCAPAQAFVHRMPWYDLVDHPSMLGEYDHER